MIALPALARLATRRPAPAPTCELCGNALADEHRHVVELATRGVQCACQACALLFARPDARYRTVPDRVLSDPAGIPADALGLPVGLAFVTRSGARTIVGYPGPAGVTEGNLDDDAWTVLAAATPLAVELVDDVEALLLHGERGAARLACYLVPITKAFELAGALRAHWRGFSGGDVANREIAAFFTALDRRGGRR